MMRSKKAQVLELAVVFIFLAMIIFVYGKTSEHRDVVITIGDKQYLILNLYTEAEKAREFVELSAELATLQANNIGTGDKCFKDISQGAFELEFKANIAKYLSKYNSSTEGLSVTLPAYDYRFDIQPSEITVRGYSDDKIQVIGKDLDYKADSYFKQIVTCTKKISLTS